MPYDFHLAPEDIVADVCTGLLRNRAASQSHLRHLGIGIDWCCRRQRKETIGGSVADLSALLPGHGEADLPGHGAAHGGAVPPRHAPRHAGALLPRHSRALLPADHRDYVCEGKGAYWLMLTWWWWRTAVSARCCTAAGARQSKPWHRGGVVWDAFK